MNAKPVIKIYPWFNLQINAAGTAFLRQLGEWSTTKRFLACGSQIQKRFRAYLGDYRVTLECGGDVLAEETFSLTPGYEGDITLDLRSS